MPGGRLSGHALTIDDIHDTAIARLWDKVNIDGEHFIWNGALTTGGRGQMWLNTRPINPARIAWVLEHGDLPAGHRVTSTCENPLCLRHLAAHDPHVQTWRNKSIPAEVVAAIRERAATDSDEVLAAAYGLSVARVSQVRRNHTYKDPTYKVQRRDGDQAPQSKLSVALVTEARRKHFVHGVSVYRLAKDHGVSVSTMWDAVNAKTWTHVPSPWAS